MKTETDVQTRVRLAVQEAGGVAWRNNVGALTDVRGVPVRFGLANDSAQLNEVFKTGDLVGLYPEMVTLMCGGPVIVGIFCMWECKKPDWRWRGTDREQAQLNAITYVRQRGGRAGFVTGPEQAVAIMQGRGFGAPHG